MRSKCKEGGYVFTSGGKKLKKPSQCAFRLEWITRIRGVGWSRFLGLSDDGITKRGNKEGTPGPTKLEATAKYGVFSVILRGDRLHPRELEKGKGRKVNETWVKGTAMSLTH